MVHFAEINQAISLYSMFHHIGRVATPKLVPRHYLRYLQTTLIIGGGSLVAEFIWGIVWKKKRKMEKPGIFFSLRSLFLIWGVCKTVLLLIGLLLDQFDHQIKKRLIVEIMGRLMDFYY